MKQIIEVIETHKKINKYRFIIYLIAFIIVFALCPYWVSLYALLLLSFYVICRLLLEKIKLQSIKKTLTRMLLFFFIFSIAISTKLFVSDIYKIPSSSMNNTLYTNDVILVNKLKYGPKLPRSPFEIPWLNIAFYFNDYAKKRLNETWWDYKRLAGTTTTKNGDIVVFTMFKKNMVIVKRCMGIAGDTITIRNGDVLVNNKYFNPSNQIMNPYVFDVESKKTFYKTLDSMNLDVYISNVKSNKFRSTLSFHDKTQLEKIGIVKDITRVTDSLQLKSTAYPNSKFNQWNLDEYGPYIVPKKGMIINLTPENYALYYKAIREHEGVNIKEIDNVFYVDEKEIKTYVFKQDYFFMMGDNRKGSMDSRVWGLVPEERIIGKVQCILWSNHQDQFQWKRLFKSVN